MVRIGTVVLAAAAGTLVTLFTGLVPTRMLMGATHYGFPMPWLVHRVLPPEHFPWRIIWSGLLLDMLLWVVVFLVVLLVGERL